MGEFALTKEEQRLLGLQEVLKRSEDEGKKKIAWDLFEWHTRNHFFTDRQGALIDRITVGYRSDLKRFQEKTKPSVKRKQYGPTAQQAQVNANLLEWFRLYAPGNEYQRLHSLWLAGQGQWTKKVRIKARKRKRQLMRENDKRRLINER